MVQVSDRNSIKKREEQQDFSRKRKSTDNRNLLIASILQRKTRVRSKSVCLTRQSRSDLHWLLRAPRNVDLADYRCSYLRRIEGKERRGNCESVVRTRDRGRGRGRGLGMATIERYEGKRSHVAEGRVLAWITRERYGKRFHRCHLRSSDTSNKSRENANAVTCRG